MTSDPYHHEWQQQKMTCVCVCVCVLLGRRAAVCRASWRSLTCWWWPRRASGSSNCTRRSMSASRSWSCSTPVSECVYACMCACMRVCVCSRPAQVSIYFHALWVARECIYDSMTSDVPVRKRAHFNLTHGAALVGYCCPQLFPRPKQLLSWHHTSWGPRQATGRCGARPRARSERAHSFIQRTAHPNNFTLNTALSWVLSKTPAKYEVDQMNGCQENQIKDTRTHIATDSFYYS